MTGFDRAAYAELSGRVLDRLQELREVDLVLDGCRDIDAFNTPQDSAVDYEAGWGRDYNEKFSIRVGRTHPFDLDAHVYKEPGKVDFRFIWTEPDRHDYGFVESAADDAASWAAPVRARYAEITEPLLRIDSGSYIDAGRVLLRDARELDVVRTDFAFLVGSDWEGDAADRFFRFFYHPFADIRSNHVWGIDQQMLLVGYLKLVNDLGQLGLVNLLRAADDLLDAQLQARTSQVQQSQSRAAVGVAAGAATVIAGITAKTPTKAGPVTIVAGALSVLAAIPPQASVDVPIFGVRADDIGEVLGGAIEDLAVCVDDEYRGISAQAADVRASVASLQQDVRASTSGFDDWTPIAPGLEVGDDGGFHHESSGRAS